MALYQVTNEGMASVGVRTFESLGLTERAHLQQVLLKDIAVLEEGLLVIAEEFGDFDGANRRIDLLALDRGGSLVVIELKRTNDGGHMELQALRYAAFVSAMTFDDVVNALTRHRLDQGQAATDAREALLDHLGISDPTQVPEIATSVRIILVSADFSQEITTTVLWLNDTFHMRIRCVRLIPYEIGEHHYVDVRQIIPLPEAEEYQIKIGRKNAERARSGVSSWTQESFLEALQDPEDREKARSLIEQTEQHPVVGRYGTIWFGSRPSGGVFLNPGGRDFGPAQLLINAAGQLMVRGNWAQFDTTRAHPGFAHLAGLLGQDHLGKSKSVPMASIDVDVLWSQLVAASEAVNAPAPEV